MSVTTHEMKLDKASFDRMDQGMKTLELRLMDEKRQLLKLGDHITFKKFPTLDHACVAKVTGLLHYPDFQSLLDDVNIAWLGFEDKTRDWFLTTMHEIYTEEEIRDYGVVGIRLKKVTE
jgi:ASC-1-like (ASCH) protein